MIYLVHFRGPAMEYRDIRAGESPCESYTREIEADSEEQARERGQAWADERGEGAQVEEVERTYDEGETIPAPQPSSGELAARWVAGGAEVLSDPLPDAATTDCMVELARLLGRFSAHQVLEALRDATDCGLDCVGGMVPESDPKAVDSETADRLGAVSKLLAMAAEQLI